MNFFRVSLTFRTGVSVNETKAESIRRLLPRYRIHGTIFPQILQKNDRKEHNRQCDRSGDNGKINFF